MLEDVVKGEPKFRQADYDINICKTQNMYTHITYPSEIEINTSIGFITTYSTVAIATPHRLKCDAARAQS